MADFYPDCRYRKMNEFFLFVYSTLLDNYVKDKKKNQYLILFFST